MRLRTIVSGFALLLLSVLAGWGALRFYTPKAATGTGALDIPATPVKRGDVNFIVYAKGELQGGNTEVLSAPQVGGQALSITFLRDSGQLVKPGDVVVQFDTTDQELKLREANSDLAEAEQQLIQAKAESEAKAEEAEKRFPMPARTSGWRNSRLGATRFCPAYRRAKTALRPPPPYKSW